MAKRKPQINFQVEEPMKMLYEEAKGVGHWVTRFCAAGLLMLLENPRLRIQAMNRLRDWEAAYENATPDEIRAFVEDAEGAMQRAAREIRRGRKAPPARRKAKRTRS